MFWRISAAILISTCGIGFATRSDGADLTRLPPGQQERARCILDVVSREHGVTNSKIQIAELQYDADRENPKLRILFQYIYHPRSRYIPRQHFQSLDITELVTTKHESIVLGGVVTAPHTSLNEIDDDLFTIAEKLKAKCGLSLDWVTE